MHVLVTGGLGYIGSHFVVEGINAGLTITVIDNLANSSIEVIDAIRKINPTPFHFIKADLRDKSRIEAIIKTHDFNAVVHFAGLKSVNESQKKPLLYYENNVAGSLNLLAAMQQGNLKKIIFSSSATVYGEPITNPYTENHPTAPINIYGQTKLTVEKMLEGLCCADPFFSAVSLRYFNPIGGHVSGLIGDTPQNIPNNLMPYIIRVAEGKLPYLQVFGDDYATSDGTGVRDYIHVMDLVQGHLCALDFLNRNPGFEVFNLGRGEGYSVLQILETFERVNQCQIPYQVKPRRAGDLAAYWADANKAKLMLHWEAQRPLDEMVHVSTALRGCLK